VKFYAYFLSKTRFYFASIKAQIYSSKIFINILYSLNSRLSDDLHSLVRFINRRLAIFADQFIEERQCIDLVAVIIPYAMHPVRQMPQTFALQRA